MKYFFMFMIAFWVFAIYFDSTHHVHTRMWILTDVLILALSVFGLWIVTRD